MGRFADIIRCHILEEYMSSYMREREVDAMLVLRNENKWAMTGKYLDILIYNLVFLFLIFVILSVIFVVFSCFSC
jgi:hypothetical protein